MPSASFFFWVGMRSWLFINRHFERSIILKLWKELKKERWRLIFWLTFRIRISFLPPNDDALRFPRLCPSNFKRPNCFKKVYLGLEPILLPVCATRVLSLYLNHKGEQLVHRKICSSRSAPEWCLYGPLSLFGCCCHFYHDSIYEYIGCDIV